MADPKKIGSFRSERWGPVDVYRAHYVSATGPLAVILMQYGARLANLSVNIYPPEGSHDSKDLPADCFYVKTWDSPDLVADALASGLFRVRDDLPNAESGFVSAPVWQLVSKEGEPHG